MPRVIFIAADGTATEAEGAIGQTVMSVAVNAGIEVILAECGGACACGTCHCYVDADWAGRLAPPSPSEASMIECVIAPRPESRLTCQLKLSSEMDGLVLHLPAAQY